VTDVLQAAAEDDADVDVIATLVRVNGIDQASRDLRAGRADETDQRQSDRQGCSKHSHQLKLLEVIRCWGPGRERLIVVNVESV